MSDALSGLVAALEKLPPFVGVTWRGASGQLVASLPLTGPLPTTRDPRVASGNFTSAALWAIVSAAGRDIGPISADPSAQEVALLPGSFLTPADALREVAGTRVQVVLEVRDGCAVGEVPSDAEIERLIQTARELGPARISQPGRFG